MIFTSLFQSVRLTYGRRAGLLACMASSLAIAVVVSACGGGGVVPGTGVQVRALSSEFTSRKAVSYAPYRTSNRDTEVITSANVKQDLTLLVAGGFKLIRLFDSSDAMAKLSFKSSRITISMSK